MLSPAHHADGPCYLSYSQIVELSGFRALQERLDLRAGIEEQVLLQSWGSRKSDVK